MTIKFQFASAATMQTSDHRPQSCTAWERVRCISGRACARWRLALARDRYGFDLPERGGICAPDNSWRAAERAAGLPADETRAGDQPEDRQGARPDDPAINHRPRRRRRRMTGFHLWTPPSGQGKTLGSLLRVVGCCHLSGLGCGSNTAAGLYGSSRTGSRSPKACSKHSGNPWLSHLWTPPSGQGKTLGSLLRVVGCCHLSGLGCGNNTAAGLYGSSRTGSRSPKACSKHSGNPWLSHPKRARSTVETPWLSQPRLADRCAILSFRSPSRPRDRGQPRPPRPEFCRCRL